MARLRVLHVAQPLAEGVPRSVGRLVADQVGRGFDVAVACPAASAAATARDAGARHVAWEATREPGPSVVSETRRLGPILRSERPDVLHLHSSKAGLAGAAGGARQTADDLPASRLVGSRPYPGPTRAAAVAWERFGARWAAAVVCVSEGERARGESEGIDARGASSRTAWTCRSTPRPTTAIARVRVSSSASTTVRSQSALAA